MEIIVNRYNRNARKMHYQIKWSHDGFRWMTERLPYIPAFWLLMGLRSANRPGMDIPELQALVEEEIRNAQHE